MLVEVIEAIKILNIKTMDSNKEFTQPQSVFNEQFGSSNQPLPNATASLVLGILSIVVCYLGWILGIIGLVLALKDKRLYEANPEAYSRSSYNNSKTGRICSIVGIVVQLLFLIIYIGIMYFAFSIFKEFRMQ